MRLSPCILFGFTYHLSSYFIISFLIPVSLPDCSVNMFVSKSCMTTLLVLSPPHLYTVFYFLSTVRSDPLLPFILLFLLLPRAYYMDIRHPLKCSSITAELHLEFLYFLFTQSTLRQCGTSISGYTLNHASCLTGWTVSRAALLPKESSFHTYSCQRFTRRLSPRSTSLSRLQIPLES